MIVEMLDRFIEFVDTGGNSGESPKLTADERLILAFFATWCDEREHRVEPTRECGGTSPVSVTIFPNESPE